MKSIIKLFTGLALFAAHLNPAFGGGDKTAKEILADLSKNTKSYSTIAAEYSFTIHDKADKLLESQSGKVRLKGKKFRLEIPGVLVVCDGKTIWNKSATDDIGIKDYEEESDFNPANIFLMY